MDAEVFGELARGVGGQGGAGVEDAEEKVIGGAEPAGRFGVEECGEARSERGSPGAVIETGRRDG